MAKRVTLTLSDDLAAAAELLRKKQKYRTLSEYVQGLVRYDGQTQRDHLLTAEWAALSGYERDRLDAGILKTVQAGKGLRGSWLEAMIEEIVKRHLEQTGRAPTVKEVAAAVAESIAEGA